MKLLHRERSLYSLTAHLTAVALVELPFFFLLPLVLLSIIYLPTGLHPSVASFFLFLLILFEVSHSAASFGHLLAALTPSESAALSLSPPLLVPLLLFGGYLLDLRATDGSGILSTLKYTSWFYFGFDALRANQWMDDASVHSSSSEMSLTGDILALGALSLVYRAASFLVLSIRFSTRSRAPFGASGVNKAGRNK